jgi:hypothetical protein
MINLPHQKPIKFANKIIEKKDDETITSCSFPSIPSLAMVCEAAAQSTAAFDINSDTPKIGFLVSLKNIEQLKEFSKKDYLVKIKKSFDFGQMQEYEFELKDDIEVFAKGFITIALQN